MPTNQFDPLIDKFLALPEDKRREAITKMKPESQQAFLSAIKERKGKAAAPEIAQPKKDPGFFRTFGSRLFQQAKGMIESTNVFAKDILPAERIVRATNPIGSQAISMAKGLMDQYGLTPEGKEARKNVDPSLGAQIRYDIPIFGPSIYEARKADVEGRPGESAGILAADVLLPIVGPKIASKGLGMVGELKAKLGTTLTKKAAGFVTKTGAEEVTRPMIKKQLEKLEFAEDKQKLADTATDAENKKIAAATEKANKEQNELHRMKVAEKEGKFQQDVQKTGEGYRSEVEKTEQVNDRRAETEQRKQRLQTEINSNSGRLGELVKAADRALRQEANDKYTPVHQATAQDPGVPVTEIKQAVEHAENNILEGSQENIKQFREIMSMESEAESIYGGEVDPNAPEARNIISFLEQQGISGDVPNLKFKDLRGYSSELREKLSKGTPPGDVKRAMKHVKEAIDLAKMEIADRTGVLPQLEEADRFYNQYMDAFKDKDSAVAQVRKSVGVKDPEYYHEPLVKGKSAKTGIAKLRGLQSRNSASLNQIADLAEGISRSTAELKGLPKTTQSRMPIPGEPEPAQPPTAIPPPKPIEPKFEKPKQVTQRREITAKKIMSEKEERVWAKASELAGARRFDSVKIISHPVSGTREVILEKIAAAGFKMPEIIEYLTRFTNEDLVYADKLPEPNRTTLINNIKSIMASYKSNGGAPISPSPALQKLLQAGGASAVSIKNRKEAKDRLDSLKK